MFILCVSKTGSFVYDQDLPPPPLPPSRDQQDEVEDEDDDGDDEAETTMHHLTTEETITTEGASDDMFTSQNTTEDSNNAISHGSISDIFTNKLLWINYLKIVGVVMASVISIYATLYLVHTRCQKMRVCCCQKKRQRRRQANISVLPAVLGVDEDHNWPPPPSPPLPPPRDDHMELAQFSSVNITPPNSSSSEEELFNSLCSTRKSKTS